MTVGPRPGGGGGGGGVPIAMAAMSLPFISALQTVVLDSCTFANSPTLSLMVDLSPAGTVGKVVWRDCAVEGGNPALGFNFRNGGNVFTVSGNPYIRAGVQGGYSSNGPTNYQQSANNMRACTWATDGGATA